MSSHHQQNLPGLNMVGRREPTVYGIGVKPPAEERMVTEVIVLTKGVNPGHTHPTWTMQASDGLTPIELIGVLEVMRDGVTARVNKMDYR